MYILDGDCIRGLLIFTTVHINFYLKSLDRTGLHFFIRIKNIYVYLVYELII